MQISSHFSLDELTHSDVAARKGLDNAPNAGEISNLVRLAEHLLEPIRDLLNVPLRVNSGFRSPIVNSLVGGATGSAHMDGRACDFVPVGMDLSQAFDAIRRSNLPYDQLILECNAWIHVAVARVGADPRRQALLATGTPGRWSYQRVD